MKVVTFVYMAVLLAGLQVFAQKGLNKKDLPAKVQRTVEEQTKGAEIKYISKEVEKGKTQYEIETVVNGKTRDLFIDATGAVVEIEEATTLESIPLAAMGAIEKAAAGGKITKVEIVTKGGKVTYEAAIKRAGKNSEIQVTAEGAVVK